MCVYVFVLALEEVYLVILGADTVLWMLAVASVHSSGQQLGDTAAWQEGTVHPSAVAGERPQQCSWT